MAFRVFGVLLLPLVDAKVPNTDVSFHKAPLQKGEKWIISLDG